MKRWNRVMGWAAMLLAAALLAGCVTSTVVSRKQERYAAYEALSPELRTLVDQGQIKTGMSMDAVYIAWGAADQVTEGETETEKTSMWTYYGSDLQTVQTLGWRRSYYSTYVATYIRAQATFTNGVVKRWQTFPAPGY